MVDPATFSLIDFVPVEPEVYARLFIRQNLAVWPSQIVTAALGVGALAAARRGHGRYTGVLLGAGWLWVAVTFHLNLYAELNWAAVYAGWAFIVQAVLLAGFGWAGYLDAGSRPQYTGFVFAALALLVYPLLAPLTGRPWTGVELFGTAPDPTAMMTLGLLLLPSRVPWWLTVVPLVWCAFSGLTMYALGWYPGLIVPAAAAVFILAGLGRLAQR